MAPLFLLVFVLLEATAVFCALRAAATARTSQGAIAWVIFLITSPWLAVPLYAFLGHHKYRGYQIARRDSAEVIAGIARHEEDRAPDHADNAKAFAAFEHLASLPVVKGCGADLLIDGDATFDAIFAAVDAAQHYILVQFYIVKDDELGQQFARHLVDAVQRGVKVRVMYDALGSHGLKRSRVAALQAAGIEVAARRQKAKRRSRFMLNYRNHRKCVVVDGAVGFTGGLNVGDEYMGRDPRFGNWRDTHVRLTGPAVEQLQLVFAEDWHWFTQEVLIHDLIWNLPDDPRNMNAVLVATGPGDELETGSLTAVAMIAEAQERLWIASPYFVPDADVMAALQNAALRGVEVRLLLPDAIDHRLPWLAAFAYFDDLHTAGVEVWRFTNGFMHQKVWLADDKIAAVGTLNLDNRSFRLNFEEMAVVFDRGFAQDVEAMLQADFEHAYRYDGRFAQLPKTWQAGSVVARLFSPIL